MGMFSFLKSAGEKLAGSIGLGDEKAPTAIATKIQDNTEGACNVDVAIDGDKVVLSGDGASPEALEKAILVAGNLEGVAAVEVQTTAQPADDTQFYTVQSGDNLSKIAKQFYGDANKYHDIFAANQPMLSHPDKIYPGQNLRIPQAVKKVA